MSDKEITNEELDEIIKNMQFPKEGNVKLTTDQGIQYAVYHDRYGAERKYEILYANEADLLQDGDYSADNFEENIHMADIAKPNGELPLKIRHCSVRLKR